MIAVIQAILAPLLAAGGSFANGFLAVLVGGLCLCLCPCVALCVALDGANATMWAVSNSPTLTNAAQVSAGRAVADLKKSTAAPSGTDRRVLAQPTVGLAAARLPAHLTPVSLVAGVTAIRTSAVGVVTSSVHVGPLHVPALPSPLAGQPCARANRGPSAAKRPGRGPDPQARQSAALPPL